MWKTVGLFANHKPFGCFIVCRFIKYIKVMGKAAPWFRLLCCVSLPFPACPVSAKLSGDRARRKRK